MARLIQCPDLFSPSKLGDFDKTLFLGGGITNCGLWQDEMVNLLSKSDAILLNPRRSNFDINDPTMTEFQIKWEYHHLKLSNSRMFWFPKATLCPITLFELGRFSPHSSPLFVGIEPGYQRTADVYQQLKLTHHNRRICSSVKELSDQIMESGFFA